MRSWLGSKFGGMVLGLLVGVIATVGVIAVPATADPVASASNAVINQVKRALGLSNRAARSANRANRRSINAIRLARRVERRPGPEGPQGPRGERGPEGPATGPAGGDLTGNYPDPEIADGAVTDTKLAPQTGGVAAFALIHDDGIVDSSRSKGITQANVAKASSPGRYCLTDLPFEPRTAQVSGQAAFGGGPDVIVSVHVSGGSLFSAGCGAVQAIVRTYDVSDNALLDRGFYIWLED